MHGCFSFDEKIQFSEITADRDNGEAGLLKR